MSTVYVFSTVTAVQAAYNVLFQLLLLLLLLDVSCCTYV